MYESNFISARELLWFEISKNADRSFKDEFIVLFGQ